MNFSNTPIPGLILIEPSIFSDERGYFFEAYNKQVFDKNIGPVDFVQDNESKSVYGVLRGLHFQKPPYAQAKLVHCINGEVIDIAVDLRQDSPTFGRYFSVILSSDNKKQLFVPKGFAHGYAVLSEQATIAYKVDGFYAPDHDSGIIWNDPDLGIDWGIDDSDVIISPKDSALYPLSETDTSFF